MPGSDRSRLARDLVLLGLAAGASTHEAKGVVILTFRGAPQATDLLPTSTWAISDELLQRQMRRVTSDRAS